MRVIFFLVLTFISAIAADFDFEKSVTPDKLGNINWTTEQSLESYQKILGKSDFKQENKLYYEVNQLKYPISLHTSKDKVQRIYFRTLSNSPSFTQARKYLKQNGFKLTKSDEQEYKIFESKEKKIKLKFSAITQKLYSVEKWF
jgi:hypothetical protein